VRADVYSAAISVLEILRLERTLGMNRSFEKRLGALTSQLQSELDGPDIILLPAIFDIPEPDKTEVFHPNLINLQVVGSHLMVPRPFGPRMKVADAVVVLKKVLDPSLHSLASVRSAGKMGLEHQTLNIRNYPETEYHQRIASNHISVDGYPDTPSDFEGRLVRANRTQFTSDQYLKPGWRRLTIPEKTVDLFEFYAAVVLSAIGLTVHWIDTWYYHVRHGGLHCGTNSIRKP
jgi:Protein-arginine deiminase (PAD)